MGDDQGSTRDTGGPVLEAGDLRKVYARSGAPVEAVRGVSLRLLAGDFVAVMGPSGCGKSTLLHLCGGMDTPTSGRLTIAGEPVSRLGDQRLTDLRRRRIGFVFQFFNLLPTLTAVENIALPLLLAGLAPVEAARRAVALGERVGLANRLDRLPRQLSGGEAQRVAVARAVVHEPMLVVADEPTGNLDSATGAQILDLLAGLNRERGMTVLLATHAADVARAAGRIVHMRDGRIEREEGGDRAAL
jgi:putative ABC transport system ATP-binding protein